MSEQPEDWYERLSRAEREVLEAYAKHHSYQAVARALGKSESVVDQQLLSARRKMNVTSTAQAMFLLADRRAAMATQQEKSAIFKQAIPRTSASRTPATTPRGWRRIHGQTWLALCLAIVGVASPFVFAVVAKSSPTSKERDTVKAQPSESAADIAAKIRNLDAQRTGDPDDQAHQRAMLVGQLSDQLWRDKWGPKEDEDVKQVLPAVADKIYNSFLWACKHDHDLAVRIIGNGHRLFRITGGSLRKWPQMIDMALRFHDATRNVAFGRLECGFALSKVCEDPPKPEGLQEGFKRADDARVIFRNEGKDSDEANALRHMGMCRANADQHQAEALYSSALEQYRRIPDQGGAAQTLLSIAQVGQPDKSPESYVRRGLNMMAAIKECHLTGSSEMLGEAWDEMIIYPSIPRNRPDLLGRFRNEMLLKADAAAQEHANSARLLAMIGCLRIDVMIQDKANLAEDMERTLSDFQGVMVNSEARAELCGFYDMLCGALGRRKLPTLLEFRLGRTKEFQAGRKLKIEDVPAVAVTLPR